MVNLLAVLICAGSVAILIVEASDAPEELPDEYYNDYVKRRGRMELQKTLTQRSEKGDTRFYPPYFLGLGIKNFCVTSRSDYYPCLGNYSAPEFSAPEGHRISYYVWESEAKAAVGYFISTLRGTELKYNYEFEDLSTLEKLIIFELDIHHLSDAFYESHKLIVLELPSNALKRLMGTNFYGTENLKKLNLSGNSISTIKEDAFSSMELLEEIDFSGNPLKSINWGILSKQKNLAILLLNNAELQMIEGFDDTRGEEYDGSTEVRKAQEGMDDKRPYRNSLQNLKHLELRNNTLTSIEPVLARIPNAEYIDWSNNSIESIGRSSFAGLRNLTVLLLNDNNLELPYKDWFDPLIANAEMGKETQLNISGNPWKCDCSIIEFYEYWVEIRDSALQRLKTSMQIKCEWPDNDLKGRFLHEIVESIRVEQKCRRDSKERATQDSNADSDTSETRSQEGVRSHIGLHLDKDLAITIVIAIATCFIASSTFIAATRTLLGAILLWITLLLWGTLLLWVTLLLWGTLLLWVTLLLWGTLLLCVTPVPTEGLSSKPLKNEKLRKLEWYKSNQWPIAAQNELLYEAAVTCELASIENLD